MDATNWLKRLREAKDDGISELTLRLVAPGHTVPEVKERIIALQPLPGNLEWPGDMHPSCQAILRFWDEPSQGKRPFDVISTAVDLAAIACLASGRRIEVAPEMPVRIEGQEGKKLLGVANLGDRSTIGPVPDDLADRFEALLAQLDGLDDTERDPLGASINLHHAAVLLARHDLRSAYVLLVAAVEVLSEAFGPTMTAWEHRTDAEAWESLFEAEGLTDAQSAAIRDQLQESNYGRLRRTFAEYGVERLPDEFESRHLSAWTYKISLQPRKWGAPSEETVRVGDVMPETPDDLRRCLKKTYDLRSRMVHRGDDLQPLDTILFEGHRVDPSRPLPFALLRQIVVQLIERELAERAEPQDLPAVKASWDAGAPTDTGTPAASDPQER